jgi:hypothetical protein
VLQVFVAWRAQELWSDNTVKPEQINEENCSGVWDINVHFRERFTWMNTFLSKIILIQKLGRARQRTGRILLLKQCMKRLGSIMHGFLMRFVTIWMALYTNKM